MKEIVHHILNLVRFNVVLIIMLYVMLDIVMTSFFSPFPLSK